MVSPGERVAAFDSSRWPMVFYSRALRGLGDKTAFKNSTAFPWFDGVEYVVQHTRKHSRRALGRHWGVLIVFSRRSPAMTSSKFVPCLFAVRKIRGLAGWIIHMVFWWLCDRGAVWKMLTVTMGEDHGHVYTIGSACPDWRQGEWTNHSRQRVCITPLARRVTVLKATLGRCQSSVGQIEGWRALRIRSPKGAALTSVKHQKANRGEPRTKEKVWLHAKASRALNRVAGRLGHKISLIGSGSQRKLWDVCPQLVTIAL